MPCSIEQAAHHAALGAGLVGAAASCPASPWRSSRTSSAVLRELHAAALAAAAGVDLRLDHHGQAQLLGRLHRLVDGVGHLAPAARARRRRRGPPCPGTRGSSLEISLPAAETPDHSERAGGASTARLRLSRSRPLARSSPCRAWRASPGRGRQLDPVAAGPEGGHE